MYVHVYVRVQFIFFTLFSCIRLNVFKSCLLRVTSCGCPQGRIQNFFLGGGGGGGGEDKIYVPED